MFPASFVRAFISITIPDSRLKILSDWLSFKKRDLREFRWTSPESMHITLKFCGEISGDRAARLLTELKGIRQTGPFDIYIEGIGGFPDLKRARVIWAAVKGETEHLYALREEIEKAASRASIPREDKKFTPHVTIGRRNFAGPLSKDTLDSLENCDLVTVPWTVKEAALMRSELSVMGARHSVIGLFKT